MVTIMTEETETSATAESEVPSVSAEWSVRLRRWQRRIVAWYPWHRAFFIGFNVGLNGLNVYLGAPWWALWPLVITGAIFLVHYLIYKTLLVDDAWVEGRAERVQEGNYYQIQRDNKAGRYRLFSKP